MSNLLLFFFPCAESDKLFAESFATGNVSDDNDIPVPPNANCKMRAGCTTLASYKNSISIACAQRSCRISNLVTQQQENTNKFMKNQTLVLKWS